MLVVVGTVSPPDPFESFRGTISVLGRSLQEHKKAQTQSRCFVV
jgi:hypothetical protein